MAGTNERREWLARHIDQFFLKNHTLVAAQDGGSGITTRYAIVDITRNMLDFITARLAFITISTKPFERFEEKGGNKMWLETTSGSAFHIFAHLAHAHHVHYLASEGTLFQQSLQVFAIERLVDHAEEAITYIRTITVAYSLDNQVAQRTVIIEHVTEHIKDPASQCLAFLFQLLEQRMENLALA